MKFENFLSQQLNKVTQTSGINNFIKQLSERIQKMEEILVVDRIEGSYAICENRENGKIINIKKSKLPKEIKEGSVLRHKDNQYTLDNELQSEIEKRISEKMNNLWKD